MADDEFLRVGILQLLGPEWVAAKDLHVKLQEHAGTRIRIFKVKSLCRDLAGEGVEMERMTTEYGYPDEFFRLMKKIAAPVIPRRVLEEEWSIAKKKKVQGFIDSLLQHGGVLGSMVVTDEQQVLVENIGRRLDKAVLAEISIELIRSVWTGLSLLGHDEFKSFVVRSSHGRIVFSDLEIAYLVVVVHAGLDIDRLMLEIESTASRIKSVAK